MRTAAECEAGGGIPEVWVPDEDIVTTGPYGQRVFKAGEVYPQCISTGVIYGPPLHWLALQELLWPDSWNLIPPG